MNGSLPAIRPSAIRSNIVGALRKALLAGRFQPGEELSDSRLAAEFSVSRGPVREALLLLAEEGLILLKHHRGFEVPRLTREDRDKIRLVRKPLESLALALAQPLVTPGDISHLVELKAALLDSYRAYGSPGCAEPDFAFHSAIWQLSGNSWLEAALKRISMPYFAYVSAFDLARRDHSVELMDEMHQRYIDFLRGKSTETAEECVNFHLDLDSADS